MNKLTNTQEAALQHIFTEYTEDTWNVIVNKNTWYEPLIICDWFKNNSYSEIREILICLEQMLQDFYLQGLEDGQL